MKKVHKERLELAIKLVQKVAGELDGTGTRCGECGILRKANFAESKVRENLLGIASRIGKTLEELEKGAVEG